MLSLAAALLLLTLVLVLCVKGESVKRKHSLKRVTTTSPRLPRPVRRIPTQHRRSVDPHGPTEIVPLRGELSSSEPSWQRQHPQTRLMTSID